ncbi:MAG: FAD-dependent oxidoreductase, partial [Longimicrobiales bacterium]
VRCPWHHACFSLRTGEAVAAPALNPLPCWDTEVRGGRAYATTRVDSDALAFRGRTVHASAAPASVVIVGAGAAGSAAAEMLRREGYAGPVTLVDPDADAPYDRPNLSKDYLAGTAPEEWIPLRPPGFHAEHGIDRIVASVTALDTAAHMVTLSTGRRLDYGALLLATGATPVRLPLPGADRPHVHVLRSLEDSRALIRAAAAARHVVIAGASFIGLEAAASLRARGLEVTVVAPERVPFERTLGSALGERLRALHEAQGVAFRLGHTLSAIHESSVVLDDDTTMDADLVLLGVGVRPLLQIAEQAGLADAHGVPVDGFLETRSPGVYAAGDIASFPDARTGERIRIEHWVVAQRQGQTAAKNMLGSHEPFDTVPFFWTQHYDVRLSYVGHASAWDHVDVSGDVQGGDCAVRYVHEGAVRAVATIDRDAGILRAEVALERGDAAPEILAHATAHDPTKENGS